MREGRRKKGERSVKQAGEDVRAEAPERGEGVEVPGGAAGRVAGAGGVGARLHGGGRREQGFS